MAMSGDCALARSGGRAGGIRAWTGAWLVWLSSWAMPASASVEVRDAALYAEWRSQHAAAVRAFVRHLQTHGVYALVPDHELLRSASDWQRCQAAPFALPPRSQWPAVVRVLQLVQSLRQAGVLGPFEVHSAYRGIELNRCAGGATGSAHLRSFAIDLVPAAGTDPGPALCAFWRSQGRDWNMGLSRYPSGRIHLDTAGYRTWGADHQSGSAFCR